MILIFISYIFMVQNNPIEQTSGNIVAPYVVTTTQNKFFNISENRSFEVK